MSHRTAIFDCKTVLRQRTSDAGHLVPHAKQLGARTIDGACGGAEDGTMSTTVEFTAPRRSARVFRKLKMQAQGRAHNGKKFRETCETLVVSAHGGLLMLKHEVDDGELLGPGICGTGFSTERCAHRLIKMCTKHARETEKAKGS